MSDRNPLLVQTGGGFSLRFGDRWLYSRYAPRTTAEKAALDTAVEPETLYLLVSPCLCYGLGKLAGRLPSSSALFAFELEPSLLQLARNEFDQYGLDPDRFRLCPSTEPATIVTKASEGGKFRRVRELRLSAGRELHPGRYDQLVESITLNNRLAWRNRMTLVTLGRLWVKNVITNLATLPWDQVQAPKPARKPIMLCGAGPSIDGVLPWIRKQAMRLSIIAVDTAAGTLLQAGIRPDLVVCLEAQAHNLPDFTPLAGLELTLVADISAHPASIRILKGPKNLVSSTWMSSRFLDRLAKAGLPLQPVPPLGSVGVLALRLAIQQGQPIFIAGLDFAFLPGKTHCKGSPCDLSERYNETRLYKQNHSWTASYKSGIVSLPGGSLGNALLTMYANSAGIELNGATAFDLRAGLGLELPVPAISLDQADRLLCSWQDTGDCPEPDKSIPAQGFSDSPEASASPVATQSRAYSEAAAAFLEGELEMARQLAARLRSPGGSSLEELIRNCDYMYAHFPDPERVETMELDALKRLAVESAYWIGRLQTALSFLRP